jgi:hypothetical protein
VGKARGDIARVLPIGSNVPKFSRQKMSDERRVGAPTDERRPSGLATSEKEHIMTTHTPKKLVAAVGATIAGVTAPALIFFGAGTAHAIQDVSDFPPRITVAESNPQPDTPGILDPGSKVGILDPGSKVGILDPGSKGIGGSDTRSPRSISESSRR